MYDVRYTIKRAEIAKKYRELKEMERVSLMDFDESPPIYASSKKLLIEPRNASSMVEASKNQKPKVGLSILIANLIIFIFSIVICFSAKFLRAIIHKGFNYLPCLAKYQPEILKSDVKEHLERSEPLQFTKQEILEKMPVVQDSICPIKKTQSHQSCQTLFHAHIITKPDQNLKAECVKLKEDLISLQSNSLKEHAVLSRRLDCMVRDKKELSKRFTIVQKENQVAKTQLDELLNEKQKLQKRLEAATKDFRINTKNKKVTLAKLEEISAVVEDLKRQLEQVTRDKQILQAKLDVMRNEYEKMEERLSIMKLKETNRINSQRTMNEEIEKAEKDINEREIKKEGCDSSQSSLDQNLSKESVFLPYVLSQTEDDVKKIQMKIFQLENTLKEFNAKSDGSSENLEDMRKMENGSSEEDKHSNLILPKKILSSSDVTCRKSYNEIQVDMLRSSLLEKIKSMEILKESGDESGTTGCISETSTAEEESEFSCGENGFLSNSLVENAFLPRIVSKSKAFKDFLKTIGAETKLVTIGPPN